MFRLRAILIIGNKTMPTYDQAKTYDQITTAINMKGLKHVLEQVVIAAREHADGIIDDDARDDNGQIGDKNENVINLREIDD